MKAVMNASHPLAHAAQSGVNEEHAAAGKPQHIALFLKSLGGGGLQRSTINLAGELAARGLDVDLVVAGKLAGHSVNRLPQDIHLHSLKRSYLLWGPLTFLKKCIRGGNDQDPKILPIVLSKAPLYLLALVDYLEQAKPDIMITGGTFYNLVGLWARKMADVPTRVIISERNALSARLASPDKRYKWQWRHVSPIIGSVYPWADAIVSVSKGVGIDLSQCSGLPLEAVSTIYNPVVNDTLHEKAASAIDHPWLRPGMPPVVLGVGRLNPQKDFPNLIRAFARVRQDMDVRLLILGEERQRGGRAALLDLAGQLGVTQDVDIPGFTDNPFAYMKRSAVFVLSSTHEGFGNVLIEAMACGCPVVSTDCPYGPGEILDDGRYGRLVPVGDDRALARAIVSTLREPPDRDTLRQRALQFTARHAADQYLALLDRTALPD